MPPPAMTGVLTGRADSALLAELTDLLQLKYDALPVYGLATTAVRRPEYRDALAEFRDDRRRHIRELTAAVRALGSLPDAGGTGLRVGLAWAGRRRTSSPSSTAPTPTSSRPPAARCWNPQPG